MSSWFVHGCIIFACTVSSISRLDQYPLRFIVDRSLVAQTCRS
jgi:hypothetical protein